jgi:hypothetical protein
MAKITEIVLDIDGKKITLTPEQAKSLLAALNELYGKKEVTTITIPYPYPVYPHYPTWIYTTTGNGYQATWNSGTSSTTSYQLP